MYISYFCYLWFVAGLVWTLLRRLLCWLYIRCFSYTFICERFFFYLKRSVFSISLFLSLFDRNIFVSSSLIIHYWIPCDKSEIHRCGWPEERRRRPRRRRKRGGKQFDAWSRLVVDVAIDSFRNVIYILRWTEREYFRPLVLKKAKSKETRKLEFHWHTNWWIDVIRN